MLVIVPLTLGMLATGPRSEAPTNGAHAVLNKGRVDRGVITAVCIAHMDAYRILVRYTEKWVTAH